MKDFGKLMEQAKQIQEKIKAEQEKLENAEIVGTAGAGMVRVTMTGTNTLRGIKIDPSLMVPAETEILEDLLTAAFNDAQEKVREQTSESMGGLLPAGMKLPF